MPVSFCFPHAVATSVFIICRGLCVCVCVCESVCGCTDMLLMCVLYESFGSKVSPITFG